MPEERVLSTYEACRWLGIDRTTLKRWAEKTKIRSAKVAYDDRITGWKESELQRMFAAMKPGYRLKPYAARDESAAVRELREEIRDLREEVTELRRMLESHIAALHNLAAATPAPRETPANGEMASLTAQRPKRDTVRLVKARSDTLPPGWVAIVDWRKRYNIPMLTITELYKPRDPEDEPKMPELKPHGETYKRGSILLTNVWDEEQQAAAFAYFQRAGRIPADAEKM